MSQNDNQYPRHRYQIPCQLRIPNKINVMEMRKLLIKEKAPSPLFQYIKVTHFQRSNCNSIKLSSRNHY